MVCNYDINNEEAESNFVSILKPFLIKLINFELLPGYCKSEVTGLTDNYNFF